ncbi:hypothetical protein [Sulfuriferula plumbiphila]|uniref:hypothetical protein n=1 Tax=Sulfuriferula plumbiphila TaxID=171865 RepID=UPI001CB93782|nr:hypothetical protein [Sulfuriferula plumbiphila]
MPLIDEAQEMTPQVLCELRLLASARFDSQPPPRNAICLCSTRSSIWMPFDKKMSAYVV